MNTALSILLVLAADAAVAPPSAPPPPQGPPPQITLQCGPKPVKVGQVLTCELVAVHRDDVSITVTAPPAFATEPPAPPQKQPDGQLRSIRVINFQPMEPKPQVKVDGLRVIWREAGGGEGRFDVPAQEIPIQRMLIAEKDPKFKTFEEPQGEPEAFWGRHGPVPYRTTNWPLIIALITVGGGLVGLGLGFLIKRWLDARIRDEGPTVDPRPAHVIALEALDVLSTEAQSTDMEVKTYYFRLSEVIRDYLERRYDFTALEMTSDEIRYAVRAMRLKHEARVAIDRFLDETDLVKFAAYRPGSGEADTVMLAARGLIQITRQTDAELEVEA